MVSYCLPQKLNDVKIMPRGLNLNLHGHARKVVKVTKMFYYTMKCIKNVSLKYKWHSQKYIERAQTHGVIFGILDLKHLKHYIFCVSCITKCFHNMPFIIYQTIVQKRCSFG